MIKRLKNWFFRKMIIRIFAEVSTTTCADKIASTITLFDALNHYSIPRVGYEKCGDIYIPKTGLRENCCGPREFSTLAIKMQRAAGHAWFEIVCGWTYDWFVVPAMVAFSYYPSNNFTHWMIRGHLRSRPTNWWSLPPNWCARWSYKKAWGKPFVYTFEQA